MKHTLKHPKRIGIAAVCLLAAAAVVPGAYAWFHSQASLENIFTLQTHHVTLTEAFDPASPVVPGTTAAKPVRVTNTGSGGAIVRLQLQESLQLLQTDADTQTCSLQYTADAPDGWPAERLAATVSDALYAGLAGQGFKPVTEKAAGVPDDLAVYRRPTTAADAQGTPVLQTELFAFLAQDGMRLLVDPAGITLNAEETAITAATLRYGYYTRLSAVSGLHGLTDGDIDHGDPAGIALTFTGTVQTYAGEETLDAASWYLDADSGYYYYSEALQPGESVLFLDSVTFSAALDNRYQGAVYTLTPVLESVQAANGVAAAQSVWSDGFNAALTGAIHGIG